MPRASQKSLKQTVKDLVKAHFKIEKGVQKIIWFHDPDSKEIRLIEVNRNALPSEKVYAFYLLPTKEVPYPVRIADVTLDDWEKIEKNKIKLPPSWSLKGKTAYSRPRTTRKVKKTSNQKSVRKS